MKYFNQNDAFLVQLEKHDVEAFNEEERYHFPTHRLITFGFTKGSGRMIRVEPSDIRQNNFVWEKLRDRALAYGQKRFRYE